MRVLQVNKLYHPFVGGVETTVRKIAEGLNDKVDMQVLVCQGFGKAITETVNGVRLTRSRSFGIFFSMPLSIDFLFQFKRLVANADIVQLHSPFPLADLAVLLCQFRGKLIVWWHSDIVRQKFFSKMLRPIINYCLKRSDSIIVASQNIVSSSEYLKPYQHKIVVIPFGLDMAEYQVAIENDNLSSKLFESKNVKLLYVGRLVYYKGVDVLLKAMETVDDAELFVVGYGALEKELKRSVFNSGLSKKVHFLGSLPKDKLLEAYKACDILVFPSCENSEAFGLVQLEAMFFGKPVINTNLPTAVPWVSLHNETGLTVPVNDHKALAHAINKLVKNQKLRKTYGDNAAKRVRTLFDFQKMQQDLLAHYNNVLKGASDA